MSGIMDMAKDLGGRLARTDEYQALKRAMDAMNDDRQIAEHRSELEALEGTITASLRAGKEPADDDKQAYEELMTKLQGNPTYQRVVAAQANFDKIVQKVNENIAKGLEDGASSRIILEP
jgi:cell fate (sporulation/competence/biofilm development) regulator YlbF (YheA/YmcA/DUF963 family)